MAFLFCYPIFISHVLKWWREKESNLRGPGYEPGLEPLQSTAHQKIQKLLRISCPVHFWQHLVDALISLDKSSDGHYPSFLFLSTGVRPSTIVIFKLVFGTLERIRTANTWTLKPLSLPIGLLGHLYFNFIFGIEPKFPSLTPRRPDPYATS